MANTSGPKSREAQREAIKTLAIAVGVREAARQLGIPESTLQARSARGKWFSDSTQSSAGRPCNQIATKPSDALRSALEDDSKETKISLSKGVRRLAKHIETLPEPVLFAGADKVKQAVSSASQLHNWEAVEQGSGVMGGLRVYSQQTVMNVQVGETPTPQAP